jgi:hypothetical protein
MEQVGPKQHVRLMNHHNVTPSSGPFSQGGVRAGFHILKGEEQITMVMAEERSATDRPKIKRTHALTKNQSKFDVVDVKEILCEDKASFKDSIEEVLP